MNIDINKISEIAIEAGKKVLDIYENEDFSKTIDFKADDSPLTVADKESHKIIAKGLEEFYPEIPVMSEEGREIPYEERKDWGLFWCVDPLDGTKEFINKNGEFTINIALIKDNFPVAGVIYAPVLDTLYFAKEGEGATMIKKGEKSELKVNGDTKNLVAVKSRSHSSGGDDDLLSKYDVKDAISVGSSLKFCMLAEGKADIYYRHGPTMEWDTAAGQSVLEGSSGYMYDENKERFSYNKENLRNGSFLCLGFKE